MATYPCACSKLFSCFFIINNFLTEPVTQCHHKSSFKLANIKTRIYAEDKRETTSSLIASIGLESARFVIFPLTHVINAFIETNNFPSSWKCARIVSINKMPTPVEKSGFRPIAILPALSKIFERLVCSQVIEFIENTQLYKDTVTGFRKGYSTGSALLKLATI